MSTKHTQSLKKSSGKGQGKYSEKLQKLKKYVIKSDYIDVIEQPVVCASFGLPYLKDVFREIYRERFLDYIFENTSTVAMVYKATGIPEKYLCQCKAFWEERNKLKVVGVGRCDATGSINVQYLSSNPDNWNDLSLLPGNNQLNLFENE